MRRLTGQDLLRLGTLLLSWYVGAGVGGAVFYIAENHTMYRVQPHLFDLVIDLLAPLAAVAMSFTHPWPGLVAGVAIISSIALFRRALRIAAGIGVVGMAGATLLTSWMWKTG